MRRTLCLLLTMVMVLTCLPLRAAADLYADGRVDVFDLAMRKRRVLRRV